MMYQEKPWLNLYDPRVDEHVSVKHESLYDFLESAVNRFGDKPAFTFYGKVFSFDETKMMVDRLAAALHKEGLRKGDRLAIMLQNCPQYVFTLFAFFRLGGIAVQVNPMYVEREIAYVLDDSGAKFMVALDAFYPKVKKVQSDTFLKMVIVVSFGGERKELAEGDYYFEECLQAGAEIPLIEIDPHEDVAVLQYTGGATGVPKGVMLTHYNLLANFNQVCDFIYNTCEQIPGSFKMITEFSTIVISFLSPVLQIIFSSPAYSLVF